MTNPMSQVEIDLLAQSHYKVHFDIDRCFKDGEDWPCRTKQLIDSHYALVRRLYPGQGEEYANEVERQRVVIDTLLAALRHYQTEAGV